MRRPGYLAGVSNFWFGDLYQQAAPQQGWRRSSSRPSDEHLYPKDETAIAWYDEFWVKKPTWEDYIRD